MLKKVLLIAVPIFLLLTVAVSYYGIYYIAPYAIIMPYKPPANDSAYVITPEQLGLHCERFVVAVDDSIQLETWFLPAQTAPVYGTVVILHGIGSIKEHMLGGAAELTTQGFNVLLYDSRAHGHSTGRYCTYGYYEKYDVSKVIDEAIHRFGNIDPFALSGSSFGGAVALQTMAIEPRIVCGVVESTFAVLDEIVFDYQRQMLHIPFRFVAREALTRACEIAHFKASDVQPVQSAASVTCPVLMVHGDADNRINIRNGKRIFAALASLQKQWLAIHDAGHENLAYVGGAKYDTTRLNFLRYWLQRPERPNLKPVHTVVQTPFHPSISYHSKRYSR